MGLFWLILGSTIAATLDVGFNVQEPVVYFWIGITFGGLAGLSKK